MAQIPSEQNYIFEESVRSDAAVSESAFQILGGSINHLLDQQASLEGKTLKVVEFLSNTVWTVPSDVSLMIVEGCGGGGGPGIVKVRDTTGNGDFFEGGFGAHFIQRIVGVVPGESITVTIGNGGSSSVPSSFNNNADVVALGGNGGQSSLVGSTTIIMPGGIGGCNIQGISLSFPSATSIVNHIRNLLYDRLSNVKAHISSAAPAMFCTNSDFTPSPLARHQRPFSEGSSTGFRSSYSPPVGSGTFGTNQISIATAGIPFSYVGGSGPFGASTSSTQSPNTGAGGQVTINLGLGSSALSTTSSSAGGSGRVRVAYVSKF